MKHPIEFLLIICLALPLNAQDVAVQPEIEKKRSDPQMSYNAGLSIVPFTKWHFVTFGLQNLSYKLDKTRSTSYEANFRYEPFSFGGSASINDNLIGKLDTILGYVGFSSVSLKVSESRLRGTAKWTGDMAYDMKRDFKFSNRVQSLELVYNGGENVLEGLKSWYIGATYTKLTVPICIDVSVQPPTGYLLTGKPAYDDRFALESYGLVFGFDMLKDKSKRPGLDIFGVSQDRIGIYNLYSFSSPAIARVRALNPGYEPFNTKGKNIFPSGASYLDNESAVGLSYTYIYTGGHIIFAVGYDVIWGLIAGPSYESPDKNTMVLEGDMKFFFRHGVIFRVYASW